MIRNAVRHMHKRTILFNCAERNVAHVEGRGHSFKFHVNKQTIIYFHGQSFFLNCFDEGKMKILRPFMLNSFKFPQV